MNHLDDSSIKFCILDEEGHIRNQYRAVLFLTILCIILITIIVDVRVNLILRIFLVLIILLFSSWWFVLRDEYQSDLFAGRMLQEKYGLSKPSIILENIRKIAIILFIEENTPFD